MHIILPSIHGCHAFVRVILYSLLSMAMISFSGANSNPDDGHQSEVSKSAANTTSSLVPSHSKIMEKQGVIERNFGTTLTRNIHARYLLYLPWHYGEKDELWPLLLYLHGGKGRGDDFNRLAWYPVPKMMLRNDSIPFIVVAPQCPAGEMWTDPDLLISLLRSVCDSLPVDTERIYLAGYSMGGAGVWYLAYKYPEIFAAISPMSGWSTKFYADRLKQIPVWVFHGLDDSLVPVHEAEDMIRALDDLNAEVKTSIVPERGHSPPSIEEHKELFDWFLKHRRIVSKAANPK